MKFLEVTRKQMEKVDEIAISSGITLESMMEKAGTLLAGEVIRRYNPKIVTVFVGQGHNGGGGLVAARKLKEEGVDARVILVGEDRKQTTDLQAKRAAEIGVQFIASDEYTESDVIVDALLGYSVTGDPRPPYDSLINFINESLTTVVSLDLPSGLDATTGERYEPTVNADLTVTLAKPKTGLKRNIETTGEVIVADIGIPDEIYKDLEED